MIFFSSGIHKSGVHNFYFSSPCAKHTQIDMILFVNDDEVLPLVVQKVLLQEDLDLKNLLNGTKMFFNVCNEFLPDISVS